jgi:uncharacterized FlgJ-related protein
MIEKLKKIILTKYILALCIIATSAYPAGTNFSHLEEVVVEYQKSELTEQTLAKAIKDMQIQHAEFVFRQAMLETGYLKSKLVKKQNNLFGMKMPKKRFTFAVGKGKQNYAKYDSWAYSVADYKVYQGDRYIESYGEFIKNRKYSQTSDYLKRLKKIKISPEVLLILRG